METSLPTSIFWCYVSFREGIIRHQLGNEKNPKLFRVYRRGLYGLYCTVSWGLISHSIKIPVKQPMESKGPRVVFVGGSSNIQPSNQPTVDPLDLPAEGTVVTSRGALAWLAIACSTAGGDVKDASLGQWDGWLFGCLVGWLGGWVVGWLGGWVVGWLGGWVVGWLGGWVVGWLVGWWVVYAQNWGDSC